MNMERNNVLLVTGASSDMGIALMKDCAEKYDRIIAQYRTMNGELKKCIQEHENIEAVCVDLEEEEQVIAFAEDLAGKNMPAHMVHFPAPPCQNNKFHKIKWEVFQKEMDISLKAFVIIAQKVLPAMAKAGYGRIVLMLSFVTHHAAPAYCANYVTTKYALLGLMKALATEYAGKGITVNGVSPSWVMTKYISNQPEILIEQNAEASPLGRNLEVEDVIPAIEFLLSDEASCINGENMAISCGR